MMFWNFVGTLPAFDEQLWGKLVFGNTAKQ
jgi:hypothetical protein